MASTLLQNLLSREFYRLLAVEQTLGAELFEYEDKLVPGRLLLKSEKYNVPRELEDSLETIGYLSDFPVKNRRNKFSFGLSSDSVGVVYPGGNTTLELINQVPFKVTLFDCEISLVCAS